MKNIAIHALSVIIVSLSLIGCNTKPYTPSETSEVVNVPGLDKKTIYNRTRQWFSQYFVSGKSVVDYENAESGTIIGNGISEFDTSGLGLIRQSIKYNIKIDIKDNKFRATTTITQHTNTDTNGTYVVNYVPVDRDQKAKQYVSKIVGDLKTYILNNSSGSNSNW